MAVLAAIVLPGAVSAAAGGTPSRIVIHTTGEIEAIALDGHRIAYSRAALAPRCHAVVVVDTISGRKTFVGGAGKTPTCDAGTRILALAGSQVAWLVEGESNTELWGFLQAASLPRPKEHRLASALTNFDPLPASGDRLADLVGGGSLLVVNRWWVKRNAAPGRTVLYTIGPMGLHRILASPQPIFAQAADGDRIAVLRLAPYHKRRLEIYGQSGRRQLAIGLRRPLPGNYRGDGIALQGPHLLVLSGQRLLVYDSQTGALRHSWPVPGRATNLDACGGIAAYAESGALHVLRLSTGKDVVFDRGEFHTLRNLELGPTGLAYIKGNRTIVFVPLKRVLAAVS